MTRDLPEMTVEKRDSKTAHGIPKPSGEDAKELQKAIFLNHKAANNSDWDEDLITALNEYSAVKFTAEEAAKAVLEVSGFSRWSQCSRFVVDDMCSEYFNMALKYCLKTSQEHVDKKDFIDGSGIGYLEVYRDRLKEVLEQVFDAKWFYKKTRPLVYALEEEGMDLTNIANAIHPGHWTYPAGHGAKFLCAVECLNKVFKLTEEAYRTLLIAAIILSHGRSGNLIHYPEDNCAALTLLDLPLKK